MRSLRGSFDPIPAAYCLTYRLFYAHPSAHTISIFRDCAGFRSRLPRDMSQGTNHGVACNNIGNALAQNEKKGM